MSIIYSKMTKQEIEIEKILMRRCAEEQWWDLGPNAAKKWNDEEEKLKKEFDKK